MWIRNQDHLVSPSLGNRDRWLSHTQSLIPAVFLHTRRMFHNLEVRSLILRPAT